MAENRSQRTKLTLADFGDPSRVKAETGPDAEAVAKNKGKLSLGVLIGIASKFLERKSVKDQQVFEGLGGQFRIIPADKAREELESGVLFVPDAFHNMMASALRKAQATDPNATVKVAFQVNVIKAKNPAGYSWDFMPLTPPDAANPIDELISDVAKLPLGKQLLLASK